MFQCRTAEYTVVLLCFCYFSLPCALFLCYRCLLDVALLSNITMAHSWYCRWYRCLQHLPKALEVRLKGETCINLQEWMFLAHFLCLKKSNLQRRLWNSVVVQEFYTCQLPKIKEHNWFVYIVFVRKTLIYNLVTTCLNYRHPTNYIWYIKRQAKIQ